MNKKILFSLFLLISLVLLFPTAKATNFGNTNAGTFDEGGDTIRCEKALVSTSENLVSISVYVRTSQNVKVGLYDDSGGSPHTLLVGPVEASATANQFNTIAVSSTALTGSTYYWLCVNGQAGAGPSASGYDGVGAWRYPTAYANSFPSTMTGENAGTDNLAIYGTTTAPPSITATFNYTTVNFGNLNQNTTGNLPIGTFKVDVTTNANYQVSASGTDFSGSGHTFSIGNMTFDTNSTYSNLFTGDGGKRLTGSPQVIDSYAMATTVNYHGFKLDIPTSQYSANYTSTVTITYANT
jgi:hypothetical protein